MSLWTTVTLIVISSLGKGGPVKEIYSTLNRTLAFFVPKLVLFWTRCRLNSKAIFPLLWEDSFFIQNNT